MQGGFAFLVVTDAVSLKSSHVFLLSLLNAKSSICSIGFKVMLKCGITKVSCFMRMCGHKVTKSTRVLKHL